MAACILLLAAGFISASFGLIRLFDALSYGFLRSSGNVEALSITFADLIVSILITLPSLVFFVGAYLMLNSHSLGWKLSCVMTVGAISLFFSHSVNSELLLVMGVLSAAASVIEISGLKSLDMNDSPVTTEKLGRFVLALSGLICVGVLVGMLVYIGVRGEKYLSMGFVTGSWSWRHAEDVLSNVIPGSIGGIKDYIIGSFLLVTVCEAVAIPLGLGAAIYLAEYSSDNIVTDIVRFFIETLAGVPSIVIGLVGMSLFLWQLHWGTSLLGGGISLAFMILPWNIRIAEEAMKAVPESYREASIALGATEWQTVRKIVLFASSPGILTGILLGLGSALGETVVVMLTAGMSATTLQPSLLHAAVPSLPVWIYSAQFSLLGGGGSGRITQVYNVMLTGSFVLVVIFLAICGVTLILRNHLTKKITGK